ncbi:MAG: hypothetical protein ACE5FF_04985, partial [Saprospiraceae bacterium]
MIRREEYFGAFGERILPGVPKCAITSDGQLVTLPGIDAIKAVLSPSPFHPYFTALAIRCSRTK